MINFQSNKIPEEGVCCGCFSIILLYFIVTVDKKYYTQTFLEECKYAVRKIKTILMRDLI